jgi:hypothetical protein
MMLRRDGKYLYLCKLPRNPVIRLTIKPDYQKYGFCGELLADRVPVWNNH